ncbi:MAG TPA: pyridoxamine 5'-phosphate oxidase family protein [Solirubrobacteraceae bacterium]|nr:pyridoxamine 5'-phosphate oxidase family protein [Solirubrobacteraceae bacterium]
MLSAVDLDALARLQETSFELAGEGLRSSWPPESAMDAAQLGKFFEEHRYCVLATATRDGRPVARPVAYTVVGASFWLATVRGSRLRNLERTPWVSLVVSDGDAGSHRAVVVDGSVTVVDGPPADVARAWQVRHGSPAQWADAWVLLQPGRLLSYAAPDAR